MAQLYMEHPDISNVVLGFFLAWFIYKLVAPILLYCTVPHYRGLSGEIKKAWDNRILSTFNALQSVILCGYELVYNTEINLDKLRGHSDLVKFSLCLVIGYMLADYVMMTMHYQHMGDVAHYFHHFFTITAFSVAVSDTVFVYFAALRLFSEISTPFVNIRWYLDKAGCDKTSLTNVVNGLLMAIFYFVFRIGLIFPYWYYMYLSIYDPKWIGITTIPMISMFSSCLFLDIFNIYWMYKIGRGAIKVVRNRFVKNNNISRKQA